ncbi:MAG: tRNA 2-thiouridine(34) synthase MnmA [Elusimicrobia bacterium]|nr:tRNA 2-thiouridine(34) synthase MnmA [Elusimicrobiota bacterium]MBD3412058.1 tRNA 2-thiouridine(34) synthase MnmA [Elusimicrobiota bacterium]
MARRKQYKKKKKVLVAMSGGVDSSVAALLLKQKGYTVVGMTMCFGIPTDDGKPRCCGPDAVAHARTVCTKLDIPHHVFDFSRALHDEVITNFVSEYRAGRTPNPCVICNKTLKFSILLNKALSMGFDYLATGHYAVIATNKKKYYLKKSKNTKDQTYFLYGIPSTALQKLLFPVGRYTKDEVRALARAGGLPNAENRESQDICFIKDPDYHDFMRSQIPSITDGPIIDTAGTIIGSHKGICFYTIGQRTGLNLKTTKIHYVININAQTNTITVGDKKDLAASGLIAEQINLFMPVPDKPLTAKIRYAHAPAPCRATQNNNTLTVRFDESQQSITPGQSVVLYDADRLIGGGVIAHVLH